MSARLPGVDPATDRDPRVLEGRVERVTFENDLTGFRVLKVAVDGRPGLVTLVGKMQRLSVGARIRADGHGEVDRKHGWQFHAHTVLEIDPDTREGVTRYLGSGLVPGVGPALAKRIVEHFGDDTLAILDRNPQRAAEVPGLGARRVEALVRAWGDQRALRDVMVFLQGHGVSPALSIRVFRRYGSDTIRLVSENPYRLALEVWGIGFRKADAIARELGVAEDAPERVLAGVLHVLDQYGERGHVFVPHAELVSDAEAMLGVSTVQVEDGVDAAVAGGHAYREHLSEVGDVVYSARRYAEELGLAQAIGRLAHAPVPTLSGVEEAVATFERGTGTALASAQRQAIFRAAAANVLVITGGPGVGKTTLVRALITLYARSRLVVRLAAPTGRASRRLAEATGREAATVHRLLEFEPRNRGFARSEKRPLDLDVVIVDESSMLDQSLALALLRAIPTGARLVLVGDVDQLPSIGAGAVLRDIIESQQVSCVRLTEIFRQASGSRIVENAHAIRVGRAPQGAPAGDKSGDFYIVSARDGDEASDRVLLLVAERIPRQFGLDPRLHIQVLSPMHKGPAGTDALNARLQAAVNPNGARLDFAGRPFRVGDKVMQLRNDYGREIYNGDVGFIQSIDATEGRLIVEIEGREVSYDAAQADELTLAYACSVHKSQGSEYPAVVIPMIASHFIMLSRNLLYTAVTRGKQLVVLVTDHRALRWALAEARREDRHTYLFRRLQEAGGAPLLAR